MIAQIADERAGLPRSWTAPSPKPVGEVRRAYARLPSVDQASHIRPVAPVASETRSAPLLPGTFTALLVPTCHRPMAVVVG